MVVSGGEGRVEGKRERKKDSSLLVSRLVCCSTSNEAS